MFHKHENHTYREHIARETSLYGKETFLSGKRNLLTWQKRPTTRTFKHAQHAYRANESSACRTRGIQTRETSDMAKETYKYGKRDLQIRQKRPANMAKETYEYGKRDLRKRQKRPTNTWGGRNGAPRSRALGLKAIASCRAL